MRCKIEMYMLDGSTKTWIGTDTRVHPGTVEFRNVETGAKIQITSHLPITVEEIGG